MTGQIYPVEVQQEFLQRITKARPIPALAELIWNGLDADADSVKVTFQTDEMERISSITVQDNGSGMDIKEAPLLFGNLGGSWKRLTRKTKNSGRSLHGQEGRGRFKAFALGDHAEWNVTYEQADGSWWSYQIKMKLDDIKHVEISNEVPAVKGQQRALS